MKLSLIKYIFSNSKLVKKFFYLSLKVVNTIISTK